MKIVLANRELAPAINFLQSITLKATDSRHRSKFVKLLTEAYTDFVSEEKELTEKFDLLDQNGQLKKEQDQDLEKVKLFKIEQAVLSKEKVTIEGGLYSKNLEELPRILNEFDGDLSGQDAEIFDRLLDEMENVEPK